MIFGVPSDMTRAEFKKKCDEIGLYCFAIGKVEREGEHFRATPASKASKEWQKDRDRKSVDMDQKIIMESMCS